MNNLINNIVSTSKGWVVRQAIKWAGIFSAAISTAIITKAVDLGIDPSNSDSIATITSSTIEGLFVGIASLVFLLIEGYLSKRASKIEAK